MCRTSNARRRLARVDVASSNSPLRVPLIIVLGCAAIGCGPADKSAATTKPSTPPVAHVADSQGHAASSYVPSRLAVENWEVCVARDEELVCWRRRATPGPPDRRVHTFDAAVTSLAGAKDHVCALLADRSVWCWQSGWDASGQPAAVRGLPPNVASIAAGLQVTCAVASDVPWCWGRLSDVDVAAVPRQIELPFAIDRAVPSYHYLAVASPTTAAIYGLYCIHSAGCFERERTPVFPSLGARVIDYGVAALYGCALSAAGQVGCWRGATPNADSALERPALAARALRLAVLQNGGCALLDTGDVQCWDGVPIDIPEYKETMRIPPAAPHTIDRGGRAVRDIGATDYGFCIAWQDGDVTCWGHDVVRSTVR